MKYLIVNADDFGYSYSVNRGIIEAHTKGIVTSTSVMIDAIASNEAAQLVNYPDLSVGLHFVVQDPDNVENELKEQIDKFITIVGSNPDHVDTHKMKPTDNEQVKEILRRFSKENKIPIRCLGFAKFISMFFGLNLGGSGTLNKDNVSMAALKRAIDGATDEYNELMCHVGYSDDYLRKTSSYNDIREEELKVIISPESKEYIEKSGLMLTNWKKVKI